MKKAVVCAALALVMSVLCHEQVIGPLAGAGAEYIRSLVGGDPSPLQEDIPSFAQQMGESGVSDTLAVTLYFRYLDTECLGAEQIGLDIRREETVAASIVNALVEGPDVSHDRLTSLFPQGTRVISVRGEGNTIYVTLNRAFLGRPDGAPADWEDLEVWQEEATKRRYLAMQSLVLALTEEGRCQRVQLYVADGDDDVPERVALYWFDRTQEDVSVVLGPCARDEQLLLTPHRMMDMAMDAWQQKDWETLYHLLAPEDGANLPVYSVFEEKMRARDVSLLSYSVSDGTVSMDGQSATLVLDAQIRSPLGGDAQIIRETVCLRRTADNWTLGADALDDLMVRD